MECNAHLYFFLHLPYPLHHTAPFRLSYPVLRVSGAVFGSVPHIVQVDDYSEQLSFKVTAHSTVQHRTDLCAHILLSSFLYPTIPVNSLPLLFYPSSSFYTHSPKATTSSPSGMRTDPVWSQRSCRSSIMRMWMWHLSTSQGQGQDRWDLIRRSRWDWLVDSSFLARKWLLVPYFSPVMHEEEDSIYCYCTD
jgi:hypothetical protein